MISNRQRLTSARPHGQLPRILRWVFLGVVFAAPAQAGPVLVATFSGAIPTLTVTTQLDVVSLIDGTFTSTGPVVSTLFDVPFVGSVTFDASVWALTSLFAPPPAFPFRQFDETDPSSGPGTGVQTPERLRGSLNLGNGIGLLSFDRHLVDGTVAADVFFPYQGFTTMGYVDGLDGLNPAFSFPIEFGDSFYFNYSNNFNRYEPGVFPLFVPGPPGEVFARGEFSTLSLDIHTGYDSPGFTLHNLFGAGPPLAFSWIDPNPGLCFVDSASCNDGYLSFASSFSHFSTTSAWGTDAATFGFVSYVGSLIPARVDLAPQAAPEPGSIPLIALGLSAMGLVRRGRARRG